MMLFIAIEMVLYAIGVIFVTIGISLIAAHYFNPIFKSKTGWLSLLTGIVLIAITLVLSNSNSVFGFMHMW